MTASKIDKHLPGLQTVALNSAIRNVPARQSENFVEPDGRRREAALRRLEQAGLVRRPGNGNVTIEEAVLDLIKPVKPDLVAYQAPRLEALLRSHRERHLVYCVAWANLAPAEQLYVLRHREQYRVAMVDNFGGFKWAPLIPSAERPTFGGSVYVADDALVEAVAKAERSRRVASMLRDNLAWATEHLLGLPEDFPARSGEHSSCPFGGPSLAFGPEPSAWAEEAERKAAALAERIAELQAMRQQLADLQGAVARKGGWNKFTAEYQARIEAYVDGHETDEGGGQ